MPAGINVDSVYKKISPFISAYSNSYRVSMGLSKAFDCVRHDLLLGKLAAYVVDEINIINITNVINVLINACESIISISIISKCYLKCPIRIYS